MQPLCAVVRVSRFQHGSRLIEHVTAVLGEHSSIPFHLIKLISRDMLARGGGDILITSSVAGVVPGLKNKLQIGAAKLMSDEAKAKAHGKQTRRKH